MKRMKKAQNTLEYALLIAAVVAGLVGMQHYVKRGFQGRIKESADSVGEQFAPGKVEYSWNTRNKSKRIDTTIQAETKTKTVDADEMKRWGSETITPADTIGYRK